MQFDSKPFVACEVNVNFSGYVPEGFGTADCVMIGGTTMRVVDFKYGKGVPVTAEENPQMKLYAIGALVQYAMLYHIDRVILTIAQLRLGEPDEWETTPDALIQWAAEYVKPRAELAYKGGGEPQPGEHCRFCKAKAQCRARAEDNLAAAQAFSSRADTSSPVDARLLTYPEIGRALERAKPFIKWFKDIEEYALQSALEGKEIPGWKVVEGRSRRQFDNTDTVFEELQAAGIDGALLYERKPLALTGIEELLGKKAFENLCGSHVVKSAGKPALVPEGDRRKPFNSAVADFEGLQEE